MISFPNCKINIGLNILNKRSDGFHDIETIFYPLSLCDALEVLPASPGATTDEFRMEGMVFDGPAEQNLCMKALRMMQAEVDLPLLKMVLLKKIPVGAGLGGGSADAAFALKMINAWCGAGFSGDRLKEMAARLGSDCAFFIDGIPVFATGRGEQMEQIELSLSGYTIVVVKPPVFVSTAAAYAGTVPCQPSRSLKELISLPVEKWNGLIFNDFERTIFPLYPEIAAIKQRMYDTGALYASMSGSGSSVFGIFPGPLNDEKGYPGCFYHENGVSHN